MKNVKSSPVVLYLRNQEVNFEGDWIAEKSQQNLTIWSKHTEVI